MVTFFFALISSIWQGNWFVVLFSWYWQQYRIHIAVFFFKILRERDGDQVDPQPYLIRNLYIGFSSFRNQKKLNNHHHNKTPKQDVAKN